MIKWVFVFMILFVSGCMSYSAWEKGMDGLEGRFFDEESSFVWPERDWFTKESEDEKIVFKYVEEGSSTRYYIYYYYPFCIYSLLVSSENKILSWRREVPRKNCYAY